MNISDRKKKILQIVVDEYINSAVPVSSKVITEKHLNDISSATVRNELASLEELGYLTQFHTSGGRIPSPLAYKFYIHELMEKNVLNSNDLHYIRKLFSTKTGDVEALIKEITKVISELTDYTSVAISPHDKGETINNIGLFACGENKALLLIVTNERILRDNIIDIPSTMTKDDLENASKLISKLFNGKCFNEIGGISDEALEQFKEYKAIFDDILSALHSYSQMREKDIVLSGEDKIFNHPEYDDIERVKNFLTVISSKEKLADLLVEGQDQIQINVKIGSDDQNVPEDCAFVSATYSAGGKKLGTYGVIGPVRMDYPKVISVLENVGKVLETLINNKK